MATISQIIHDEEMKTITVISDEGRSATDSYEHSSYEWKLDQLVHDVLS